MYVWRLIVTLSMNLWESCGFRTPLKVSQTQVGNE